MDFEDEPEPQQQRTGAKKRFRKNKLKVVFDPEERKNFLLGFRKRKQERKEKYVEKLERDLAKEKKRIKQQTERATKKLSNSHAVLPEVKSIIDNLPEKQETYDLGNTLVSITSLDDQIYRNVPLKNERTSEEEEDSEEEKKKRSKKIIKKLKAKKSGYESDNDEYAAVARTDPFFNPINDEELSVSELSEEEKEVHYNPLEMLRKNTMSTEADDEDDKKLTKAKLQRQANRVLQESDVYKKMQRIKQKRSKKFRMFRLQPAETSTEGSKGPGKPAKGKACRMKVGGKKQKRGTRR